MTEHKDVALLGGGCNPIGIHHQLIAQVVWLEWNLKTWVMPCYQHRFNKNSELIESAHRWNMVSEACEQYEYMEACDWELVHEHDGALYTTMEAMSKMYPEHRFHIIIGSDNANVMERSWYQGTKLIDIYPFIVMQRPGEPLSVDWPKSKPHKVMPFTYQMSSTDIRAAIRDGRYEFAKKHLDPRVWEYIIAGHLYGYKG